MEKKDRCAVKEVSVDLLAGNGNALKQGETPCRNKYIIPNYQRGYRWTKSEVEPLLNDIYSAMQSGLKKYCLQPVSVMKRGEETIEGMFYRKKDYTYTLNTWKVIDGQQRLTTIYLILGFLYQTNRIVLYDLEYDTREKTNERLSEWISKVRKFNPEEDDAFPTIVFQNDDSIDIYYLGKALQTIEEWFSENNVDQEKFLDYLRNKVIFLWYEFDSTGNNTTEEEIKFFTRINMGKIPLTVSELLKAILLRKKTIEKEPDNEGDDIQVRIQREATNKQKEKLAEEQQFQRAVQWDQMERALTEDSFFRFIYAEKTPFETRMDYLFTLEYLLDHQNEETIPDKEEVFRFYENKIISAENNTEDDLWKALSVHFSLLQEWYEDRVAFHKIGFIIATSKNPSVITLRSLINAFEESSGKAQFYGDVLDRYIRDILKNKLVKPKTKGKEYYDISELTYGNKSEVQIVLLLFNVLSAMKSPDYRFSFEYVYPLDEGGSIEHIFPQTPNINEIVKSYSSGTDESKSKSNDDKKSAALQVFIKAVEDEFAVLGKKTPTSIPTISDDSLAAWWSEIMNELGVREDSVQGIGNLALISKNLNTRLTNKMFFAKQCEIKEFDKEGSFIPICTHNAFLKYYSVGIEKTSGIFWEEADMESHKNSIISMLSDYLPV